MVHSFQKDKKMQDKQRGCLIGLAVGDALGAAVEFRSPGSFPPVTCYRDGGPHNLDAGQWTDDTSMALALADSLGRGWSLKDQMEQYVRWYEDGEYSVNGRCFDIGCTTRTALEGYMSGESVHFCGPSSPEYSGNGSIMRLAPVPMKYGSLYRDGNFLGLARLGGESSLPTHGSNQCISACEYLTMVLAALMSGETRENVLDPEWPTLKNIESDLDPLVLNVAKGSFRTSGKIKGSGWVIACLEAALWAFHDAKNFEEAVLKAVNLGDDADTTGAVCGQLAGAFWGESGIPESLRSGLARMDMIERAISSLE